MPADAEIRAYGGWRRARGIGLFGLGEGATVVVLACLIVPLLIAAFSIPAFLVCVPVALAVGAVTVARWDGVPLPDLARRRLRWVWGTSRGYTALRSGVLVEHPRAWQLPGALAAAALVSGEDGRGGEFGVVWDQRSGLLTATLRCAASSTWLVDAADADGWVSNWHSWLASLGYDPTVVWVAVTVDTAPEPGSTLAEAVAARLDPAAPADARAFMAELVKRSPAAAADVDTRVSITFDPARGSERLPTLADQVAEVSRRLTGLESALSACGVTVQGRARDFELAGIVRTAFDPAARGEVNRLTSGGATPTASQRSRLLRWADAGPVTAAEQWEHYRHDSGVSVSWGWYEAPRQHVPATVLTRLLSPGRYPRRVTLMYRPMPAGAAGRLLESQVNAGAYREAYRRAQKRDETARDRADREQAMQAAREEARGAGVVMLSCYATVTVLDPADLAAAVADTESRADQSKIVLRRLWGAQQAGFAATLPCGVFPPHLSRRGRR